MDVQKTHEFAESVCKSAYGNLTEMNRIAQSKALKFYMDNVYTLRTIEKDVFTACYPQLMEEIEDIRLRAEKTAEAEAEHTTQSDRIATLEAKMDKLTEALNRFMAAADEETNDEDDDPEPEPEAPKKRAPRRKKDAAADSDPEDQDDPADDAEADESDA